MKSNKSTNSKSILLCMLAALLWQCSSNASQSISGITSTSTKTISGKDSLITLNIKEVKDTVVLKLSELINNLDIIQLEDKTEAYVAASGTVISENYIGVMGTTKMPFKLFNRKTGKYIGNAGNIGRGPGEYFTIYSAQIDEPNQRVYLLPWMQDCIQVYDLEGKPVITIPTPYRMPKAVMTVDANAQTITIGVLPFEGIKSAVWQQDFNGKILGEVAAGHLTLTPDYSNEVLAGNNTSDFDYSLLSWQGEPDTLYHFLPAEQRLKPVFTIDFNYTPAKTQAQQYTTTTQEKVPIHSYQELPDRYIADISFPKQINGNWTTSAPVWVMVDKATLKACYFKIVNDFLGNIPVWPFFKNGGYIANMAPQKLVENLEKALKENSNLSNQVKTRIESLLQTINPDGNNVILTGTLK